jgi:2-phospho-L-lactate transferase/gluconeogenesis factor (CofD/UPF0052 family)
MRVVIVGAGTGGLCLAHGLRALGVKPFTNVTAISELTDDPSFDEISGDADVCACDMKTALFDIVQARASVGTATDSPIRLKSIASNSCHGENREGRLAPVASSVTPNTRPAP